MVPISIQIKKMLADPLHFMIKIRNKFIKYNKFSFVILMYHQVIEEKKTETYLQGGMYVNASTFRRQMEYINENFNVLPLNIISEMITDNKRIDKPYCFLTFDDGWSDFYINAYPVLKQLNLSATVFLPTNFIGSNKYLWTEKIAHVFIEKGNKTKHGVVEKMGEINDLAGKIDAMDIPVQIKIEKTIDAMKSLPLEQIELIINELAQAWHIDPDSKGSSFLSWEEVKEMYKSEIIAFGSHTRSHRILTTASEELIREELVLSRKKLIEEGVVSTNFIPFAYPNGNFTPRIAKMVEETGYSLAVTTQAGWGRATHKREDFYQLKRIGIHQDITSTNKMLACRIDGIF